MRLNGSGSRWTVSVAFALIALTGMPGCGTPAEAGQDELQVLLDGAVDDGLPGVISLVQTPRSRHLAASGFADRAAGQALRPEHLFRIASNSKTFLAIVAAELHVEGRLDLDAPIKRWLPASITSHIAHSSTITTRQMLQHTSGIYDYLENDRFWDAVDARPGHRWTTLEAVAYAFDRPAEFSPGQDWSYSNTNYLLAGLIVDTVTQHHHSAEIRSRILQPLGLNATSYEYREPLAGTLVHGYADLDEDGTLDDTYRYDQGYGLADGGMISSASDLAVFIRSVGREDGLLAASVRREVLGNMVSTGDDDLYGLGISRFPSPYGFGFGHGGNLAGYSTSMDYFPEKDITIVACTNGSDGPLDAKFDRLGERLRAFAFRIAEAPLASASGSGPCVSSLCLGLALAAGSTRLARRPRNRAS